MTPSQRVIALTATLDAVRRELKATACTPIQQVAKDLVDSNEKLFEVFKQISVEMNVSLVDGAEVLLPAIRALVTDHNKATEMLGRGTFQWEDLVAGFAVNNKKSYPQLLIEMRQMHANQVQTIDKNHAKIEKLEQVVDAYRKCLMVITGFKPGPDFTDSLLIAAIEARCSVKSFAFQPGDVVRISQSGNECECTVVGVVGSEMAVQHGPTEKLFIALVADASLVRRQ